MPDAIGKFSPEAVIEAIEQNMVDSAVAMGRTDDGVVFRGTDVTWVYTGFPTLSRVLRARFTDHEAEDRVAEIAECFRQWNAPVIWVVGPSTWPPQLPDFLKDASFSLSENWMGLATDLLTAPLLPARKDQLRIELITEAEELKTWTLLNNEPWPGDSAKSAVNVFSPENAGADPRCRYYLGYVNDKAVVRGLACVKGETAGLYWIDTTAEHRDIGYELALASRALSDARDLGAKIGVLAVRDGLMSLYKTIGFKPYCQFSVYAWPPVAPKFPLC
jgi:hypothetical protein